MPEIKVGDVVAWKDVPDGAMVANGRAYFVRYDVDAAKLLASEAPTRAEGPHGAGLVGASGRGAGEGGDA